VYAHKQPNVSLEKDQTTSHQVPVEHKAIILSNPPLFLQRTMAQRLLSNLWYRDRMKRTAQSIVG